MTSMLSGFRFACASTLTAAALCAALVGCKGPTGSSGGRIDPYRTTSADMASSKANISELLSFSDQTAAALAQDLAKIDEIEKAPTRVVLEMGDIANHSQTPTSDFEMIQRRVRGEMMKSPMIRERFLIVEGRSRMNRELARVNDEPVGASGQTAKYDAQTTYVLQGDFYEATRGARSQYYFEFKLTNLATRAIVFMKSYDLGQVHY